MNDFKISDDFDSKPKEQSPLMKYLPFIIVIVVSLIIGLTVFLVSNMIFNKNNKEPAVAWPQPVEITNDNVQILYSYVTYGMNDERYTKYLYNQNVGLDSFSNKEKLYYALKFAKASDFKNSGKKDEAGNTIYNINEKTISEYTKRYFGENINFGFEDTYDYVLKFSEKDIFDAKFTHTNQIDGYNVVIKKHQEVAPQEKTSIYNTKLLSAQIYEDETLEIKEKVIYTDITNENGSYKFRIFNNYQKTNIIGEQTGSSFTDLNITNDLLEKGSTVIYTFKVNNGLYYFYSSSIDNGIKY